MISNPSLVVRKYRKTAAQVILFFSLALGTTTSHAQEIKAWELILLTELPVVLFSGVASQSPEFAGAAILASSVASFNSQRNSLGKVLTISSMVSLGLMNSLELTKSKHSKSDVFLGNFVGINAMIFVELMLSDTAFRRNKQSGLELRIHPDNYFVGYRHQF